MIKDYCSDTERDYTYDLVNPKQQEKKHYQIIHHRIGETKRLRNKNKKYFKCYYHTLCTQWYTQKKEFWIILLHDIRYRCERMLNMKVTYLQTLNTN